MSDIDIYTEWLQKFKHENKISYTKLGESINYSDVGVNKAIRNKTLSIKQIKIIAEKFKAINSLEDYISNSKFKLPSNILDKFNDISDDELSLYILKNKERFLQNEVIKLWIDTLAIEKAKEILKDEIKDKK